MKQLQSIFEDFLKNKNFFSCENILDDYFPNIIYQMSQTSQDPVYHAEGDVWTHTKMTVLELIELAEFKKLSQNQQFICFWAMLMHDIGKPKTTKTIDGKITAKGHSLLGAKMSQEFLYKHNVDFQIRQDVFNIIAYHQKPFYILEKDNYDFLIKKISWTLPIDLLIIVAKADILGRNCIDQQEKLDSLDFLQSVVEETDMSYFNHYSMWRYLQSPQTVDPKFEIFNKHNNQIFMLCGLPGSGKDTYIKNHLSHLPQISLDNQREILKLKPGQTSPEVIFQCTEQAKKLLAKKQSFVFNATNLLKDNRQKWLDLFFKYDSFVEIIYLEKNYSQLIKDDAARGDKSVGVKVLDHFISKMDIPQTIEAHKFSFINTSSQPKLKPTI